MSNATAPSPMRSLLLALLMITSTMTAALTTLPWMIDEARADPTFDGSDASGNSSSPSQVTTFNMQLNGTLDSTDQGDWYYVELFSGDSVDFEASCMYSNCGTMMSFEPGTQGSMSYSLTTNSSDVNYSFTNYGSTTYNLTFGFENWALQSVSTYLFTIDMTPSNNTGGGNSSGEYLTFNQSTQSNTTYILGAFDLVNNTAYQINHTHSGYSAWNGLAFTPQGNSSWLFYQDFSNLNTGCYNFTAVLYEPGSNWTIEIENSTWPFAINMDLADCMGNSTTNGTSQDDMGTGGDVTSTQATSFFTTHSGTVGGNDSYDSYWVYLYPGNDIEFDANCANQVSCYIMLMANVASTNQSTYYNLTTNYSDSVFTYTNNLTYYDMVSFTFMSVYNTPEDYEFYIQVHNASGNGTGGNGSGNGTGGNGSGNNTGSWSPPTLSLDITELVDHGSATNYSIEFSIDDMDYNSTYSWAFMLLNESMDMVFEEEVQSASGNTSVSIEGPENFQGGGTMLDDGCYVMAGFAYDETAQMGIEPVFDFLSVGGGSCTSVFVDVVNWPQQSGDPIGFDLLFIDLDLNSSYTVSYEIWNHTSLVASGNLTTYAESDMYNQVYNVSSQGLAVDCYEVHVELYDDAGNLVVSAFHHVDEAHFEIGNPTCGSPDIHVWTDDYSYNAGDGVEVTIETVNLDDEETYNVHWSLYEAGTYVNGSSFNVSNADWAENIFTIWGLTWDGCFDLHVNLTDDYGNHFNSIFHQFEIGSGSCNTQQNYPTIDVWSENEYDWDTGDTVIIGYEVWDLNADHIYTVEWEVHDRENWNMVASGSWNETAGVEENYGNFSIGNLADGCYEVAAELIDNGDDSSMWDWMDDSITEIAIGADTDCHPMSVWIDGNDFASGENASFEINMDNLHDNTDHTIRIELHKQRVGLDSTHEWDFTSDAESMEIWWDFGPLEDGCYDIQVYLASDDGDFARSGHGFRVGDVECAHPWVEMNSDRTTFEGGSDVFFDMTFYDFPVNQSVDFNYEVWDHHNDYNDMDQFSHTITSWNDTYSFDLGLLEDGCYEFSLDFSDDFDHYFYGAQFAVGSPTDEEGNDVTCWDPYIHIESADHRHEYSDTDDVDVAIKIDGLQESIGYYVHWEVVDDESSQHENGSYTVNGVNSAHDELSLGPFAADGRCLELHVFLFEEGHSSEITYSDWRFEIGDGDCWPPQVDVWAHGGEHWDENDNAQSYLEIDIRAWDLDEGQEYNILWAVYDEDGTLVDDGEENEFSWHHDLNYRYELYNLSDGCYDVEVYLHDNEWNLLSEDDEEKVGIGMEVDCWAEPGVNFDYNWRGQIEFQVWDLRYNDTYLLSYEIYDGNENIGGGSFEFVSNGGWEDFPVFVTLDAGEYWVEVTLSEAFGGDVLAEAEDTIYVGDNSEEVWIEFNEANDNHHFGSGEDISLNVGVGNLDWDIDYVITVKLIDHRNERETVEELTLDINNNGEYEFTFATHPEDGFYDIIVDLLHADTDEWYTGNDKGICVGDGCPTGENIHGDARMNLTVYWQERPADDDNDDCWRMEVQLIPEQRWLDAQDGNSAYGPYPDWSQEEFGEFAGNEFHLEYDSVPEGDYYVNVRMECSGEIDGEWTNYWGVTDHKDENTWVPITFMVFQNEEASTHVSVDLHTEVEDHDDGGGDDDIWEFLAPYATPVYTFKATVKEGPDGTELHLEWTVLLNNTDVIAAIDDEIGDGDGVISQDEMDLLNMLLMEEDYHELSESDVNRRDEYWNGVRMGEDEFEVGGERLAGLVDSDEDILLINFMIFSIEVVQGENLLEFWFYDESTAGQLLSETLHLEWICEGSLSGTFAFVPSVAGADGWMPTADAESDFAMMFTQQSDGNYAGPTFDCEDTDPGKASFHFSYDDGSEPEPEPEPEVNSPPFCQIEWYRDGDDMSEEGMPIYVMVSLGTWHMYEEILVTAGDTFSVYFECEDPDGDEMTLVINPPFGSTVNFSAQGNVNRFVQLTIPSGTQGSFDFTAEWYDAASGGEYDFKVIIEAPEEGEGEETEEDSTSAASFVPGFSAMLSFTALLGAVIMLALRREDEE